MILPMTTDNNPLNSLLERIPQNWPEMNTPQFAMSVTLRRLARLLEENSRKVLMKFGLTTTEFEVLAALRSHQAPHRYMPSELYDALLISSGGLTKVLKSLEARGLIWRPESDTDKRSRPVQLSSQGLELTEEVMRMIQEIDTALWQGTKAAEISQLQTALQQLTDTVEGMRTAEVKSLK